MSSIETSTTQQSDVLETNAAGPATEKGQPTVAGQETSPPSEEPLEAPTAAAAGPTAPDQPATGEEKRAISARKLAANRANAQHSTGPKTPEGKEKSRFNAVKHGFTARYFPAMIQAGTAEWEEFAAVRTDLFAYYQPIGAAEHMLVEKLIIEYARYRRLVEREQQMCVRYPGAYLEVVNKLARYQTAINRQLFEAMKELERLQAKRQAEDAEDHESGGSSD